MSKLLQALNEEMTAVVQNVRPAVVQLTNGHRGSGAGTIWHADGLILTNAHVAQRQSPNVTLWDGREFPSKLLASDEKRDLAALMIDAADLPTIKLGRSTDLKPGDWVFAVGHPWGVLGAVSAGAVIDVGVPIEWQRSRQEMVQVGIQLRPGHSGGPLVDSHGRLVGINTMISGPQVGLAVPVHIIKRFLKESIG